MRKVILASHGRFAEGIEDSVNMIIGKQENLETFGMRAGESAVDFAEKIKAEILENPDTEFVIMTDLYGASVCTAMSLLSEYENVKVFSGMNLGMVLDVLTDTGTESCTDAWIEEARKGIREVKIEITEQEDF